MSEPITMPAIAPGEMEGEEEEAGVLEVPDVPPPLLFPPLVGLLLGLSLLLSSPPLGVLIVPEPSLPPPPLVPPFPDGESGVVVARVFPNCDALVASRSVGMSATFSWQMPV